jgi:NAD+ kinase
MSDGARRIPEAVRSAELFSHADPLPAGAVEAVAAAAEAAGCRLFGSEEEIGKHGGQAPGMAPVEELDAAPDVCIALGGDGTILRAMRHFGGREVPVFGVNYGTVGFLAAAESHDLDPALGRAFGGDFEVIELPGLDVSLDGASLPALNDVTFTRRPHHRVADLSYRLGGKEVGHVRCDGLVAATPVGSTGYNLANGGPILAWGVEGYVVSFIAPHTLTARALVVAPDDVLHVHNLGDRDSVDVAIDGVPAGRLEPATEISVGFRDRLAQLAQMEGETFYRRIREKFGQLAH